METFDFVDDPSRLLGGSLLVGDDGKWVGSLEDGSYVLSNGATPGAVRYFYFGVTDGSTPVSLSVAVSGRFDGASSGAGLIYRYDPANKGYFAFVLTGEGYALYRRGQSGLRVVSRGGLADVNSNGTNTLTVEMKDSLATLKVNERRVFQIDSSAAPRGSRVGLIAIDRGHYRFDDFSLSTE